MKKAHKRPSSKSLEGISVVVSAVATETMKRLGLAVGDEALSALLRIVVCEALHEVCGYEKQRSHYRLAWERFQETGEADASLGTEVADREMTEAFLAGENADG